MARRNRRHRRSGLALPWRALPGGCFLARIYGAQLGVCRFGRTYSYQVVRAGRVVVRVDRLRSLRKAADAAMVAARAGDAR